MKNYICTSEGFLKSSGYSQEKQEFVIEYTDKIREAQAFNTKAATKFMENHGIKGFIWKPYAQEAIRDMYVVRKRRAYGFDEDKKNDVEEWQVEKAFMEHESDINFLTSKSSRAENQDMMTFDEAKAKALELNMEMMNDLNDKVNKLTHSTDLSKLIESSPTYGRNRPN
jgi:hypothetical protein